MLSLHKNKNPIVLLTSLQSQNEKLNAEFSHCFLHIMKVNLDCSVKLQQLENSTIEGIVHP